jgi:hypothetical protein
MATTSRLYSIAEAARMMGTYHARVRHLLVVGGIEPSVVGGYLVLDAEQFKAVRHLHRTTPKKKPGPRPKAGPD